MPSEPLWIQSGETQTRWWKFCTLAQDLLQACVMHVSKIDDLVRSQKDAVGGSVKRPTSYQDSVFLKIMLGVMLFIQSLLSNSA